MRVLNAEQMREADRRTIEEIGIASVVLMENAGRQVVAAIEGRFEDELRGRVAVVCGRGSNGGDGFVIARTLHQRGAEVIVFVIGDIAAIRGDARANLEVLGRLGLSVVEIADEQAWELHSSEISQCSLIVDAIFGTGLNSPLGGMLETIVADINASGVEVVAVDLPSGMSADTPDLIGDSIESSLTVTLGAPKLPLVLPPAEARAGDIVIADIGIPAEVIESLPGPRIELLTRSALRELVTPRQADGHKGDFGHVLVVGGSTGKSGAPHLTGLGALRSGAGLVTVATPRSCQPIVASLAAEYMTVPLEETTAASIAVEALDRVLELEPDVIAVGPGLGRHPSTADFVLALIDRSSAPLVLDADALNALAGHLTHLTAREGRTIVLTPHPGEMARLLNTTAEDVQRHRIESAVSFASLHHVYVVLKGHRTLVATPQGDLFINPTGNPGMATGGTGDVLTGMLAAWLGQLLDASAACRLAVFLHGAAGDLAEAAEGEISLVATDLVAHLGDALLELTARRKVEPAPGHGRRGD
jgi:NAD(P)H-hydrate epimerase